MATLASADDSSPELRLARLRENLSRLRVTKTSRHPDVLSLERQIADLEQRVASQPRAERPKDARSSLQLSQQTLQMLRKQLAETETELHSLDEQIREMPGVKEEMKRLEERAVILRENHVEVLRKLQSTELGGKLLDTQQGRRVSVLNLAEPPSQPHRTPRRTLALALVASLCGAIAVGIGLELLHPVILSPDDVAAGHGAARARLGGSDSLTPRRHRGGQAPAPTANRFWLHSSRSRHARIKWWLIRSSLKRRMELCGLRALERPSRPKDGMLASREGVAAATAVASRRSRYSCWNHGLRLSPFPRRSGGLVSLLVFVIVGTLSFPSTMGVLGVYDSQRRRSLARLAGQMAVGAAVTAAVLVQTTVLLGRPEWSSHAATIALAQLLVLCTTRLAVYSVLRIGRRKGRNVRHVVVIGTGPRARAFAGEVAANPSWGLRIVAFLDDSAATHTGSLAGTRSGS